MASNLIEMVKNLVTPQIVSGAASSLGESEGGISKALQGIFPTVFGGLLEKTSLPEGTNTVAQLAGEHYNSGILGSLGNYFGTGSIGILSSGAGFLNGIFGSKADGVASVISNFAGIKTSSATSLLSLVASAVLAFLGKHATENNLNANGIANLLNSQNDNIRDAIPTGLNLGSIFGDQERAVKNVAAGAGSTVAHAAHYIKEPEVVDPGGFSRWILPVLLLILLAMASWYMYSRGSNEPATSSGEHHGSHSPALAGGGGVAVTAPATSGRLDSTTGNYEYELGKNVTIDLPNSAGKLDVGEFSTENKLYKFLLDTSIGVDTVKGNWFEFTNVRFKTGSADITDESMVQLKNMVAISKAFPAAKFKVGGYTDNTGNAAANISLSQKRAETVAAMLKKLGAASSAITGAEGYGPQHPIGDNASAEGRAMNRRVAVNVKAK